MSKKSATVACGHQNTGHASIEVLREGGNAIDAAIAGFFSACINEPVLASPGGGGFAMIRPRGAAPMLLDFFTQTPGQRKPIDQLDIETIQVDFGRATQDFHIGCGTIATPGAISGVFEMHRQMGRIPFRELVVPAIEQIKNRVAVSKQQADILKLVEPIYNSRQSAIDLFASRTQENRLIGEGEVIDWSELADVLDALGREGKDIFYRGEIAGRIQQLSESSGGSINRQDLENYQSIWRTPLKTSFRQADIWLNPMPSSGGCLIMFALQLLDRQTVLQGKNYFTSIADCLALTNEARLKTTSRSVFPDLELLLDDQYVAEMATELAQKAHAWKGTTHLSVVDDEGTSIAMTVTNGEGCGEVLQGTGVMLNNMLGEEDLNPRGINQWPLDERLSSMMSPTIMQFDNQVFTMGSGGSNRIRSSILQTIVQLVDLQLDVRQAMQVPRLHMEGETLNIEGGVEEPILQLLSKQYPQQNRFEDQNFFFGGVHSVVETKDGCYGVGDPRRSGVCLVV
ncbi:MAG: gamma-glutamyltranspeptidase/glutathione hydrolase [Parasphingorhabdus sp.]|jgi:gamma-glutamyltranspeptidase/glutathione hydrolase